MSDLPSVDERPGTYAMFAAIEGDHELAQQLLIEMSLAQLHQFAATAGSLADMAREICRLHGPTPSGRPTAELDADGYSFKDVAADADGAWWMRAADPRFWVTFASGIRYHVDHIPQPLTLIVRAGETTDLVRARQTAMAREFQNSQLRRALSGDKTADPWEQVAELRSALERARQLNDHMADLVGDPDALVRTGMDLTDVIAEALAKVAPLRGGE